MTTLWPITLVVELERQKDLANQVDDGPLIQRGVDALSGFESLVLGMLDEDAIFAVPGEIKCNRAATLLHIIDGNQSSGRISADGNGSFHTTDKG